MNLLEQIERFLAPFIKEELLEEIMGDLYEYQDELSSKNKWMQGMLLWYHTLHFIRPTLVKTLTGKSKLNDLGMLKLNFTLALRQFGKQRTLTFNSALLLIISTLSFLMIFRWVDNEWSRDQFHSQVDRLHLSTVKTNPTANLTSISLSTMFQLDYQQFPEIAQTAQVHVYGKNDAKISTDSYDHWGKTIVADSNFLALFDFEWANGGNPDVLDDPTNLVITDSFAKQLFGTDNPLGQTVQLSCDQTGTYQIGGVLKDLPATSSIRFDVLVPRHSQPFWRRIPQEIILSHSPLDLTIFNEKIKTLGRSTNSKFPESELSLTPFSTLYLSHPVTTSLLDSYGNKDDLKNLAVMAGLLLLIGWLGFNHLQSTTVLSFYDRLGIQQVLGSSKTQLWYQLMAARSLLGGVAFVVTLLLYQLIFDGYTHAFGLPLDARPGYDALVIASIIGTMITSSLVTARWQLSRLGQSTLLAKKVNPYRIPRWQKGLASLQMAMSMSLMIISTIVWMQFKHMGGQKIGYHHDQVVAVDYFEMLGRNADETAREQADKNFNYLKDQLAGQTLVHSFSQGDLPLANFINATSWKRADPPSEYTTENMMIVDPNYLELLELDLVVGRFFSDSLDQPNQQKVVINEAAMNYWGITDITSQKLQSNTNGRREFEFEIIGVVQDYHYEHLSQHIKPLVLRYRPYQDDQFLIRFEEGKQAEGLRYTEALFREMNPKGIYQYTELNQELAAQYLQEERLGKIAVGFTACALLLSGLCLFTIAVHESHRRTKELGVRKVMGASAQSIFTLQSKSYLKMLAAALLLALPLSYYFEIQWLADYASRVEVGVWVYVLFGALAGGLTVLASGWQAWRTSLQNPVDSLRME